MIQQKLPDAKILLLGILPRDGKLGSNRQRNDAVNRIMAGFGASDRLRYLDIGRAFLDARGELLPGALLPDNLHPSAKGYQLWYDAMRPTLFREITNVSPRRLGPGERAARDLGLTPQDAVRLQALADPPRPASTPSPAGIPATR